jgi:excisionase family DNA binding protein
MRDAPRRLGKLARRGTINPLNIADLNLESLDKISREQLPALILKLLARFFEPVSESATDSSVPDRLITVDTAAERLAFTPQYPYDLIRKGQFPAIREGKYLRIRESDLSAWIDKHQEKSVDNKLYYQYSTQHERKRTERNKKVNGTHARANGGQGGREGQYHRSVGAGRIEHFRTCQPIHQATCDNGKTG